MPDDVKTTVDDLAGLLVTKPAKPDKGAVDSDATRRAAAAVGDDHVDDGTPGDAGADDEALWTSADDADDATGAEHADGGDGDGDGASGDADEDPAGKDDNEPFYTVTIDGKQERVALSEALAGYQRTADYTRKTQVLSDRQKAVDAEFETARKVREGYDALLKGVQEQVEGSLNVKPEDWEKLKAANPAQYATEWADYQRRLDARNQIVAERKRIADEGTAENTKKLREYIDGERVKLLDKVTEWKDPEKYTAGAKTILDFVGKQYGFSQAELNQAYDHRMIVMARDAHRLHVLLAKQKAAKEKLDTAPAVPPRGRTPAKPAAQRAKAEATQRFHRTGKVDDAVALILTR